MTLSLPFPWLIEVTMVYEEKLYNQRSVTPPIRIVQNLANGDALHHSDDVALASLHPNFALCSMCFAVQQHSGGGGSFDFEYC
jgi:hypothetical protein